MQGHKLDDKTGYKFDIQRLYSTTLDDDHVDVASSREVYEAYLRAHAIILKEHEVIPALDTDRLTPFSTTIRMPLDVSVFFRTLSSKEVSEALIGDLLEGYERVVIRRGRSGAILWFWRQVLTSLPPFAWASLKRISGLEAIYRRIGR